MPESYAEFFHRVTGQEPLPYQLRYGANPFTHTLLIVPTGLGKTHAVLLPWLYAQSRQLPGTPTRLVVVLPRQNLTMQTAQNARQQVRSADLESRVRVVELMAGSNDNDATIQPFAPTIIVSTQDLYFSRALNRGYARRPPRWPIDFALYNQDCLIVLDEIQLMDDALATSTQLAAFRESLTTYGSAPCVWMSATVNPKWLQTVDFQLQLQSITLDSADLALHLVNQRINASKELAPAPSECRQPQGCAEFTLANHRPGTRTLVIANTVLRAREIHGHLVKKFPSAVLLHSRFRPGDRKRALESVTQSVPAEGQIVVATQVLEAGVDITSRLLITDLAPWGSLVQRFGRVNRYGQDPDAKIFWVDEPTASRQKDTSVPYQPAEIVRAHNRVRALASAAPASLPAEDGPEPWTHVLRRADLLDLFDTSPDLSGNELDVSRFIRATEDKDVYLAWREWEANSAPPNDFPELTDDELCPVSIGDLRDFLRKHDVLTWQFATETWERVNPNRLYPGMLAVTRTTEGGYTERSGWLPDSKAPVPPILSAQSGAETEGDTSDPLSQQQYRQTLAAHTGRVVDELHALLQASNLPPSIKNDLSTAAAKHDWGKVHDVFQATLQRHSPSVEPLAKQVGRGRHSRPHFRHELASALAMLAAGDSDLSAYLAAAHHGRVRLTIRSMPGETEEGGRRLARGIFDGDVLPECHLSDGLALPAVTLSLSVMKFGAAGGSWTDRMLEVLSKLGPFRMAYLEMLLRTADENASKNPGTEVVWA